MNIDEPRVVRQSAGPPRSVRVAARPGWLLLGLALWMALLATAWVASPADTGTTGHSGLAVHWDPGHFLAAGEGLRHPARADDHAEPALPPSTYPSGMQCKPASLPCTTAPASLGASPAHTPYAPRAPPVLAA